jgi:hypothetical protein
MRFPWPTGLAAGVVISATTGCSGAILVRAPGPTVVAEERVNHDALGVPPGHLPPPGECRIWYPGRPPGHQPPPVRCAAAASHAPAGTWVLYRPAQERRVVHARDIDPRRAGVVVEVRVYDADRGKYLRTESR